MHRWQVGMALGCGLVAAGCELIAGIGDRTLADDDSQAGAGAGTAGAGAGMGGDGGGGSGASGAGGGSGGSACDGEGGCSGPGPYGALPTGYCCTSDQDCRHRQCLTIGGVQMCSDICRSNDGCLGAPFDATCVGGSMFEDGLCEPVQAGTACVPADQFMHGTRKLGACCTPTFDGTNGAECEGNHCSASGDISNPYICTQACEGATDCPGPFSCVNLGIGYAVCVSQLDPYTCN